MPERDPAERFDDLVDAVLSGADVAASDVASLDDLLLVANDLRGLPSDAFRERLGAELARLAEGAPTKGAAMASTSVRPVREGFHTVTPYLHVERVTDLLAFLTQAFGAVETLRHPGSAGGLHAEMSIGDSKVMMGGHPGMAAKPAALHLYVEDADAVYARALEAGATTLHPLVDQPYGDREASVRDPFGNFWYIATHVATPASGHRPPGLRAVTPYFHPRGTDRLIDFLRAAFGGEVTERHQAPDGSVQHAKVRIGDSFVEVGEAHGQWQPMPAALYLYVDDVDTVARHAVAAGAALLRSPENQPYGERVAYVEDPAGNIWYVATPLP